MNKQHKRISKLMSLILRHQPDVINVQLDQNGWLSINELIAGINRKGIRLDRELLQTVVETDNKQRYTFNEDGTKIRANQGHSISVDLEMETKEPPEFLYHGTAQKFMSAIKEKGLLKMSRQHVHLSAERETAVKVGQRRGVPIILSVRSGDMHRNGIPFFLSENGVWLCEHVPSEYINFKS